MNPRSDKGIQAQPLDSNTFQSPGASAASSGPGRLDGHLETSNPHVLTEAIQRLNPGVRVELIDNRTMSIADPIDQLKLPAPFYYNEKNGITNKHRSESGMYASVQPVFTPDPFPRLPGPGSTFADVAMPSFGRAQPVSPLETANPHVLTEAIQQLNPGVKVELIDSRTMSISVPIDKLKLPEPFYYNEKNGITNKHKSASGMYASVRPVATLDPSPKAPPLETANPMVLAEAIQRLNPRVKVQLIDHRTLSISVPIGQLTLPEPFYYNEKNGITNKHTSASGWYASVRPIEELDGSERGFTKFVAALRNGWNAFKRFCSQRW